MAVVITGASDDLIEIDGDIVEEFSLRDDDNGDLVVASDGTVLRVRYTDDGDGIWRITPVARGAATLTIEQCTGDDDGYTDTVTLDGDIAWVLHGNTIIKR